MTVSSVAPDEFWKMIGPPCSSTSCSARVIDSTMPAPMVPRMPIVPVGVSTFMASGLVLGDGAADEFEGASGDRNNRGAGIGVRVVDHLVEGDLGVFAEGERRAVDEDDFDVRPTAGFDDVALVNGIAGAQLLPAAVGSDGPDLFGYLIDLSYWIGQSTTPR